MFGYVCNLQVNPYMTIGFSHPNHFGESSFIFYGNKE